MRSILICSAAALISIATPALSQAAELSVANHFYGGMSLGGSRLQHSDDNGSVFRLYGGYQLTENFGLEAGYMRLGDLTGTYRIDGSLTQEAKARAFYTAGTARWQIGSSFSVSGLLGVARSEVNGEAMIGDRNLSGKETSVMVGFGAQYKLSPRTELTLNVDHLSDISAQGDSADTVTAGIVMRF